MNKENMHKVADAIERELVAFNMVNWHTPYFSDSCGTAACVGGTAELIMLYENLETPVTESEFFAQSFNSPRMGDEQIRRTSEWLGISYWDAFSLFMASSVALRDDQTDRFEYVNENRDLVPDALRWMAETGKTNWMEAFEYARCVRKEKERGSSS